MQSAKAGALKWSDARGLRGRWRELVWMSVVTASIDLADWRACIKQTPTRIARDERWSHWLAQNTLHRVIRKDVTADGGSFVTALRATKPKARGYLALAILSKIGTAVAASGPISFSTVINQNSPCLSLDGRGRRASISATIRLAM